jgi:hypothetical protein
MEKAEANLGRLLEECQEVAAELRVRAAYLEDLADRWQVLTGVAPPTAEAAPPR